MPQIEDGNQTDKQQDRNRPGKSSYEGRLVGRQTALVLLGGGHSPRHVHHPPVIDAIVVRHHRTPSASVRRHLAPGPGESVRAGAGELVDAVIARTAVLAWVGCAFVDIGAAVLAGEARMTGAPVVVDQVVAQSSVGAGLSQAVVHVSLTRGTHESGNALTLERVHVIRTSSSVPTHDLLAVVDVFFAPSPFVSRRTNALISFELVLAAATCPT